MDKAVALTPDGVKKLKEYSSQQYPDGILVQTMSCPSNTNVFQGGVDEYLILVNDGLAQIQITITNLPQQYLNCNEQPIIQIKEWLTTEIDNQQPDILVLEYQIIKGVPLISLNREQEVDNNYQTAWEYPQQTQVVNQAIDKQFIKIPIDEYNKYLQYEQSQIQLQTQKLMQTFIQAQPQRQAQTVLQTQAQMQAQTVLQTQPQHLLERQIPIQAPIIGDIFRSVGSISMLYNSQKDPYYLIAKVVRMQNQMPYRKDNQGELIQGVLYNEVSDLLYHQIQLGQLHEFFKGNVHWIKYSKEYNELEISFATYTKIKLLEPNYRNRLPAFNWLTITSINEKVQRDGICNVLAIVKERANGHSNVGSV